LDSYRTPRVFLEGTLFVQASENRGEILHLLLVVRVSLPESTSSSSAQYMICTVKLDEEKSKHPGLVQENGFRFTIIAVAGTDIATACTCRKECNKYDLTAAQCF